MRRSAIIGVLLLYASSLWSQQQSSGPIQLPSGQTLEANPGRIAPLNSSPFSIALSPDGHYAALLHAGFGTQKSGGCQSISIFNFSTNQLADFPDDRLCGDAHQSYFVGITFSADSNRIYASIGSITDPTGEKKGNLGNAVAVYQVHEGKIVPERIIKIPPTKLAEGKWVAKGLFQTPQGTAIPYPAGLAVVPGNPERLLIANNFSDTAILIDASPGDLINGSADPIHQFDLSTNTFIPSAYPYTVVVSKDGRRGWCSLWNASRVVELNLESGRVARTIPLKAPDSPTAAGSHPTAPPARRNTSP